VSNNSKVIVTWDKLSETYLKNNPWKNASASTGSLLLLFVQMFQHFSSGWSKSFTVNLEVNKLILLIMIRLITYVFIYGGIFF